MDTEQVFVKAVQDMFDVAQDQEEASNHTVDRPGDLISAHEIEYWAELRRRGMFSKNISWQAYLKRLCDVEGHKLEAIVTKPLSAPDRSYILTQLRITIFNKKNWISIK